MSNIPLPAWATEIKPGVVAIDADTAYPQLLDEFEQLGQNTPEPEVGTEPEHMKALRKLDPAKPDQYWMEVVAQAAKLEVRRAYVFAGLKPWPPHLKEIRVRGDKRRWAQRLFPEGRGVIPATKGKEARALYLELRGFLPG